MSFSSHPPGPSDSRRDFVKKVAGGAAGLALCIGLGSSLPASSYGRALGANDRIRVGVIGVGRRGRGLLLHVLDEPDTQVVALCDVYQPNLDWAADEAPEADTYTDFREVLGRSDVDAVVIGTPDHWHALPTIRACEAGKDVYVEKPASLTIHEGRRMVEAARQHDRVVQVGTQQRSAPHFQEVVQMMRDERLGPVSFVRTWNYGNEYPDGIGHPPDGDPPPGLDWDMWLGPAPKVPFNPNRFGVFLDENREYKYWARFRWFWDYAGGQMTDWGVHLLDIVHWALGVEAPEEVSAVGGTFSLQDNRTTPDTMTATYRYPSFACHYEYRKCSQQTLDGRRYGIVFHGTEGVLFVDRGGFKLVPGEGSALEPAEAQSEGNSSVRHVRNFLDCVKSRERPISDVEIGHRSSSAAMLGNIAYRTRRHLRWNADAEQFVGDSEAGRLLTVAHRSPWAL